MAIVKGQKAAICSTYSAFGNGIVIFMLEYETDSTVKVYKLFFAGSTYNIFRKLHTKVKVSF